MHPSSIRSTRLPPAYPHCPENARAFQAASDYGLARGLHHSSADKEPSAAELRVTHPFRIAFEVVGLRLNVVPQFGLLGTYRPQRSDQVFDLSLHLSMYKEFNIRENVKWQIRSDAHNAGNFPWFGALDSTGNNVTRPLFGHLKADIGNETRVIVAVMKVIF